MTLPDERTRAVLMAEEFLLDLLDAKKTPKVPFAIRKRASYVIKHFPRRYDLVEAADKSPNVFAKPTDGE